MTIYIKGMELPKSCHECPFLYVTSVCDGSESCPIIPVPDHGRLIEVPRWISVKERLPENNTRVIGFMAWKAMTAVERQNNKWYSIDHLESLPDEAVTHWMPLPEPPQEVDNG